MRRPGSSSKHVVAALVAATFGLTAGTALAQPPQSNQDHAASSHRPASRKSVRELTSQVKRQNEEMRATTGKLNRATAQLKQTTHRLNATRAKETRVASAEHHVRRKEHSTRSGVHARLRHPANTTPPPR
jgi:septal ring factor EnvC (AmiA/AmiB activator)